MKSYKISKKDTSSIKVIKEIKNPSNSALLGHRPCFWIYLLLVKPASQSLPGGSGTLQMPLPPDLGFASFQAPHSASFGFFEFRASPPPGTSGSSTMHQPILQASSSDEKERADDMDESSQWFSSARYDYTYFGAFLDMGSGSPIDDLVESVCRENGSRTDTYVSETYSRQTYRRTYQTNFHPVLSENFWRDVPFNLIFYPPNMKKEQGRKQGKRF
ncbi:hypothetical protein M9H77_12288 [Catharanthus roseus]|uniref:Uncharacterized protein n=1 Tax=Catharanthus roseus TaxID=4058 RepID=A0ACC0BH06_CATRO|nr:hypothetical protein M9H77_12288 [Catharanthus roseus]